MRQEGHPDSTSEGEFNSLSRENVGLRNRLEIYRCLLWAAVFLIVVLFVAQCAHYR